MATQRVSTDAGRSAPPPTRPARKTRPAAARSAPAAKRGWRMGPSLRKLTLTAHVVLSVGWIGLAGSLIALAVVGLGSGEAWVYRAIGVLGETFLLPLGMGSLVTGILLGVDTKWGLVRHYWVAAKLVGTIGLVLATQLALGRFIASAAERAAAGGPVGEPAQSVLGGSIANLVLLIVMTVLSVYKPWGRTRRRKPMPN